MKFHQMNRWRAFWVHLLISSFVAGICASLVFFVWYSDVFSSISGVSSIFLLIVGVDVIIGPIITLVVFNPQKKELRFDLALVASIQFAALVYGVSTLYITRPVYLVFNIDRFNVVYANDVKVDDLGKVKNDAFKSLPKRGVQIVAALLPADNDKRNELLFGSLTNGSDLAQMPQYYVDYSVEKNSVIGRLQSLEKLRKYNDGREFEISKMIDRYQNKQIKVGYLPIKGKTKDGIAVVSKDSAEVVELVDLVGW